MAFLMGSPKPPSFPSGRYERTNPLRRYAGLRLLSEPLPERLRWAIRRCWRQASYFEVGMTALPSLHRQRPGDALLAQAGVHRIALFMLTELEVSRRVVEAPQVSLKPEERDALLSAQGEYLRRLYVALARLVGTEQALAICEQAIEAVG
ncbi:MAG TPA: hypothetical protein VH590_02010 [Ktedonobacterales bacterium]|jgi:hypothetical protein